MTWREETIMARSLDILYKKIGHYKRYGWNCDGTVWFANDLWHAKIRIMTPAKI